MTNKENLFEVLGKEIVKINSDNGWKITKPSDWETEDYKILAVLMLITSEISEAVEAFRKNDKKNFAEELADVIIRTLDLTTGMEIDIYEEILNKMEKNRNRGYKHGGKRV